MQKRQFRWHFYVTNAGWQKGTEDFEIQVPEGLYQRNSTPSVHGLAALVKMKKQAIGRNSKFEFPYESAVAVVSSLLEAREHQLQTQSSSFTEKKAPVPFVSWCNFSETTAFSNQFPTPLYSRPARAWARGGRKRNQNQMRGEGGSKNQVQQKKAAPEQKAETKMARVMWPFLLQTVPPCATCVAAACLLLASLLKPPRSG